MFKKNSEQHFKIFNLSVGPYTGPNCGTCNVFSIFNQIKL